MDLDLDPDLAETLAEEADERGFKSAEAYARWLLEHRQAVLQPPGERVEARLDQLAGRVESLAAALTDEALDQPRTSATSSDPSDWFDASRESHAWNPDQDETTLADEDTSQTEPEGFAFVGEDDVGTEDDEVEASASAFAYSDDLEPPGETADESPEPPAEPEDGADDDEIADAIADVDIEEETDGDADSE
ncbi:hypothetical protein HLRTI_001876 [Halorhabdus tiamatea SARL4B]|uniref:Uncharacterized protein n=1 Tax=Halorhabdus tiamatea SARL4B TaxID=1033806 RepID=U2E1C6_9EURY|nr:hypothetical protein [Halorhabdus tiamatea]ERJ06113.1 hypothetical protein HLRTI_001876 [Halorhabdus tiamatea SARL4B]